MQAHIRTIGGHRDKRRRLDSAEARRHEAVSAAREKEGCHQSPITVIRSQVTSQISKRTSSIVTNPCAYGTILYLTSLSTPFLLLGLLLLSLLGGNGLNRGVLVLGSDLDGSLGLGPEYQYNSVT
jgi:hypothetical protein